VLLIASSPTQLPAVASEIISFAGDNRVFLFYGDMGAGKTTLIKALCSQLCSTDNISSPTFAIVNEYKAPKGNIYHFDFYRLKTQTEALDIGIEEYIYSGNYCFIEWPEKIPDLLPMHYISIKIKLTNDNARHLTIEQI
jgi:tRNA threonylcarbamoyladenosine biosynthesis protein TsaE